MPTCPTCLHFNAGQCTRFPEWKPVSETHYCGEHRNVLVAENGADRKFTDDDLIKRIRNNYGVAVTWGEGLQTIADEFGVSKKTVEMHVRRLARLQMVEIERGAHGRRQSLELHPGLHDWEWWVAHCAKTGEKPDTVWKTMVDKGEMSWPGSGAALEDARKARRERPAMVKWTYDGHLLPALVAACPVEAAACRYSAIARVSEEQFKLPRAAFDRLLRQAVDDGKAGKTGKGLYFLKSQ